MTDPKNSEKAKDKKPEEEMKKDLHRPAETLGEAPAGGPNAEERSRLTD